MLQSETDYTPLTILYRDDALVVVDKPAKMLVHRSMIDRHETVFVMQLLRDQLGMHVYPIHRLDKPTSGVLIFALSSEIARLMSQQLADKQWHKRYIALVRGWCSSQQIDYALKEKLDPIVDKKAKTDKPAQSAVTNVTLHKRYRLPIGVGRYPEARYSLVECEPLTGRKHQLRRHLAHVNHPIVGDTTHGDGKHNQLWRRHLYFDRLGLHSSLVKFQHPLTHQLCEVSAAMPLDFTRVLEQLEQYEVKTET